MDRQGAQNPLADSSGHHRKAADVLTGTLADLVARAQGRSICCLAPSAVSPRLSAEVAGILRRQTPDGDFVNLRIRHPDDRRQCWHKEHKRFGAGIVITRAAGEPAPVAGAGRLDLGEHAIDATVARELADLARQGIPISWQAVLFPSLFWEPKFAVEFQQEFRTANCARLVVAPEAALFRPVIDPYSALGISLDTAE
jgi:hypothetical protein